MWLFEVEFEDLSPINEEHKIKTTKVVQYIVAETFKEVYEKIQIEISDSRELLAIKRHVPICTI